VMLVGLAAKNGILIVEFANQRRDSGLTVQQAILDAAATRMRPILMTSIATIAGAMPLMLATGAGAGSRTTIGVVVVFGVALSTLLSLFVVPAFYLILAPRTRPPDERKRMLHQLERREPGLEPPRHRGRRVGAAVVDDDVPGRSRDDLGGKPIEDALERLGGVVGGNRDGEPARGRRRPAGAHQTVA